MTAAELLVLDLDGVLVESQDAESRALWELAGRAGAALTLQEAEVEFRGKKMADCVTFVEGLIGAPVEDGFVAAVRARCEELTRESMRPVDGVADALERIDLPMCVASSSPAAIIEQRLRATGLWARFAGRAFSAYEVGSWKPDPGLFLYTAAAFGVAPEACVVVEDSLVGVRAGLAAGMRTLGYADGPYADLLAAEGVPTFDDMRQLPRLVSTPAGTGPTGTGHGGTGGAW
ncbi:HAD family hydrolase [Dactylosporangium maewongense]|uniref:HAD family hydrolase n=1 Tax=Dactylosporangium maewongense TaxID=634393 RepID=A0ABN1ZHN6_9ACTN